MYVKKEYADLVLPLAMMPYVTTMVGINTYKHRHEGARFTAEESIKQAYDMGFIRGSIHTTYGNIPDNIPDYNTFVDRQWNAERKNLLLGRALTDNEWDRK